MTTRIKNVMADMTSIAGDAAIDTKIDSVITATLATQGQAEAGTDNATLMTPLRTSQQITGYVATQAEAEAGSDNGALMTALRTKQAIDHFAGGTGYTPTVVGTSGGLTWTTDLAHAVYYLTSDGSHRMAFNIRGHFNSNTTSCNVSITGVVFKAGFNQAVTVANAAVAYARGVAVESQAYMACDFATGDSVIFVSGDVLLNAKPSWA